VNLKTDRDRRLFTAYAVTAPLPHVGRPILNLAGAMGSGKTTVVRVVKRLWDPTAPETVRLDPRDFLQKASHAYVVVLDNQNTIPEWAADVLCRLVTGEADSKRTHDLQLPADII
jgi:energy-coupling factor transporter ATP-binding protein EcfA2